MAAWNAEAVSK
ncbi:Protein of unknown function [Weissella confusa LBAE C39-2]|nr:Protein of unknown function [Weissella confusa LBAE C39-2]